jgi:hypothetical protein
MNGTTMGLRINVTVSLYIQITIDKIVLLSVTYACPYHNPTTTMGHSVHNLAISKPLTRTMPYKLTHTVPGTVETGIHP